MHVVMQNKKCLLNHNKQLVYIHFLFMTNNNLETSLIKRVQSYTIDSGDV